MNIKNKKESGQVLILVLLVVVVALAVGLSASARNLTNLRTSTQAEQSQRAFTAAEGGVEDVLSKLNTVANVISTGTEQSGCKNVSSTQANCSLANESTTTGVAGTVNVVASTTYQKTVEPGDVAQINLAGSGNAKFWVEWGTDTDKSSDETASMEFTFICGSSLPCTVKLDGSASVVSQPAGAVYQQVRFAYGDGASNATSQSGFSTCTPGSPTYHCKVYVELFGSADFLLLRMKPFWNRATIKVTPGVGTLPVQTYEITSVATTDTGVSRKVQVYRDALPQLPAVFDYVLYSGGDIIK